jgi:hypothetical protein
MMQANALLQENENSSKSIAAKPILVGPAKAGAGAAPSRRFGTSLSINTNAPVSTGLAGKGLPTTAAAKPAAAPVLSAPAALPLDHVTAADIAGAMDIDIADR